MSDLQAGFYSNMLKKKKTRVSIFATLSHNRDEFVTVQSQKKGGDNLFQFDIVMKCSKPSSPALPRKLHGTVLFKKKGYFEEVLIDIGTMNNCIKVNIPTLIAFCVINCRQTQKDIDKDILNYVDMKMLAQVNSTKNTSEKEMKEAKNRDPNSNFVLCTFPIYKGNKLLGITEHVCLIFVLGDKNAVFFNNDFANDKKPLRSGHGRKKLANQLSCMTSSFMKRPIKERSYNTKERCKIFCYTPQLCDRAEKANINNNMPFIPFTDVNKESFGENFCMADHAGSDLDKKASARKAM